MVLNYSTMNNTLSPDHTHFRNTTRSLRDECQELVRLKKITQEELDALLGKPPPRKVPFREGKLSVMTGNIIRKNLKNVLT